MSYDLRIRLMFLRLKDKDQREGEGNEVQIELRRDEHGQHGAHMDMQVATVTSVGEERDAEGKSVPSGPAAGKFGISSLTGNHQNPLRV